MKCLSPKATEKRRTEFFLGRLAASRALQAMGASPQPVLKAEGREPVWQEGIVGAITHKGEAAVAVAARKEMTCGVGVDLESLRPPVRFRIYTKVCTGPEAGWIAEVEEKRCIGCGACAAVCPTGHARVEDADGRKVAGI